MKYLNKSSQYILSGLIITTLLSGLILSSTLVSADNDSVVDEINITVPISCTLSGTGTDSHNATINNGQYNSAIGESTIKAFCNDSEGFAIYAVGFTDDEPGKNVLSNSTLGGTFDISTGTLTAGNASQWAMKLSTITSPAPTYPIIIAGSTADADKEQGDLDFTSFQEVPDDYTKIAYRKAGTDINPTGQSTAEGATIKSTYQVYISQTQPAGTYIGQVKYTLVHPNDATKPTTPVTIESAMQAADKAKLNGYYKMQDLNSTIRDAVNVTEADSITELIDTRDNSVYKVAKLKDGNIWMTENLDIAGGTALSSEDTDFDPSYTLPTTNGWTVNNNKLILPASALSGFNTLNYAYVYNSGNKENCGASGQNTPCYSYYSWDAATLGSGRNISTNNTDAPYSICPKNWKLPTSRTVNLFDATTFDPILAAESDYYNLAINYGMTSGVWSESTNLFYEQAGPNTTPNFLLAGYIVNSSYSAPHPTSLGSAGYYWASTHLPPMFVFHPNLVDTAGANNYYWGLSIRCLLKTN